MSLQVDTLKTLENSTWTFSLGFLNEFTETLPAGLHCGEGEVRPLHAALCWKVWILLSLEDFIKTLLRFAAKRFRKAQCPIVERLCNSLMMHGRNNGEWANGHPCLLLFQWCYIYFRSPDSWCRYLFLISLFACVVLKCLLTKSLPTPYFQVRSWWPWGLWSTLSRSSISSLARTPSRQTPCSI